MLSDNNQNRKTGIVKTSELFAFVEAVKEGKFTPPDVKLAEVSYGRLQIQEDGDLAPIEENESNILFGISQ